MSPVPEESSALLVSVVVPTCGRPALLRRCLAALFVQELDAACYEVIVVDDRPDPATRAIAEAFDGWPGGPAIRYVPNIGTHGPAAARNRGWRSARAPVVAFTDDDTEPAPAWLARGLAAFEAGADTVCGRIVMPPVADRRPTDYERDARRLEHSEFVTANCLCRREVLEALDGFDERFRMAWREDSDLHFRLLRAGARLVRAPDAVVVHPVRPAPWGVSLGQQKKVIFDALLFRKHPALYRQRIRAAPRWDYYAVVGALAVAVAGVGAGETALALGGGFVWAVLTARFCAMRLTGTSRAPAHVAEMIVTSLAIPALAVFWRVVGALRFRVVFV